MSPVLAEAKHYLYRHGVNTDTTVDPVDLIRDLTVELEKHETKIGAPKKPRPGKSK